MSMQMMEAMSSSQAAMSAMGLRSEGRMPEPSRPAPPPGGVPQALALAQVLEEIDYGLLVLDAHDQLVHANHAALSQLDEWHPLQLQAGRRLRAVRPREAGALQAALEAARHRGLRTMVALAGPQGQRSTVAVIPLAATADTASGSVLVVLGKRRVCEELTAVSFGKTHGLTAAETRVLLCLCNGDSPAEAARRNGVKVSTTRTHISSIRTKLGARNLDELVRTVAVLPPLMGSLRRSLWSAGGTMPM
ncbi:MAG: helix-turn-helix transcriptional regulator [Aquincola tertiaricarbonis]|uniref:helix-turn-helix transcriptional regulator n=1 Tax=Aquincola sp. J276 TaxID=2898432 RepID=UPI002150A297|nr:LuxR C-terminal-related transcriptional regulator [Aquincola sp. J276]MCR5868387.1 LuxR C-terminal-related transcriptional regulator [Aquincola sp. J276]